MNGMTTPTPESRSFERQAQPRAWKVYAKGWGDKPVSVTMATSRGRAITRNLASAQDAGYGLKWSDFKAARSPEHDGMFERHGLFSWSWDHAQAIHCNDMRLSAKGQRGAACGASAAPTGCASGDETR